ncbi:alpha-amylase family glycosyl hydrolase [Deinococcus cellulosilyticus]|uniref:Alpha-amylase n=1 Tax=Deinococcus cellulosilyticus (strain DSM 18568 / NBRC 106333 / KACC 11606 / 5516J-15) TaxID=1223518 RepID=A0A511N6Q2_DEIC1|nr:alpha-amylase family glycosyl hydrolase [Deinococcus cellulosilyticus]GEM48533.1 hypothetical protein DC3_41680 [Deinococcus cellulosilyticus NBRC 106333 = KACC 11606]
MRQLKTWLLSLGLLSSFALAQTPDFSNDRIYFLLTDRFANGDPSNDLGANPQQPLNWHGGDFKGIIQKIKEGYFQKLGFSALWITPVYLQTPPVPVTGGPNAGSEFAGYHGYWAEDYFKVDPHLGTLEDLKELVKVAHDNGLKVVQDMVVNHMGYGATLAKTNPGYFHTDAECNSSTSKDQDCPLAGLPDLKQELPEVQMLLNDAVSYWVKEVGIDGIRMDTMKHSSDAYWPQFFAAGGPADPEKIWTVGEVFDGNPVFLSKFLNFGSPSVLDFGLYGAIKDSISGGGDATRVAEVLAQDSVYPDARRLSTFIDNHDVKRFISEAAERGVTGQAAVERLDLALSLIYTLRGTPVVYYGTELAAAGEGDPYNYPLGRSNREDMKFEGALDTPISKRLMTLNQLRASTPALRNGRYAEVCRPYGDTSIFAFKRSQLGQPPLVVVMNNGDSPIDLGALPLELSKTFAASAPLTELTGKSLSVSLNGDGNLVGSLPARTLYILTAERGAGAYSNPENPCIALAKAGGASALVKMNFTVDARSQGNGPIELRRFDTGSQVTYPMQQDPEKPGFWKTSISVPKNTLLKFKYGNLNPKAQNSGYEGYGEPDRSVVAKEENADVQSVYNFIVSPVPTVVLTGKVLKDGQPVANALVALEGENTLFHALTREDGTYHLPLPAGKQKIRARHADSGATDFMEVEGAQQNFDFNLK